MKKWQIAFIVLAVAFLTSSELTLADFRARDPGVRGGPAGAGAALPGLTADEQEMFEVGLEDFSEEEGVADGVGPRFNFVGCAAATANPPWGVPARR